MKKLLALTIAAAALLAGRASAEDATDPRYFSVDENTVTIEEITEGVTPPPAGLLPPPSVKPVGEVISAIDSIVNLVDKIWTLIEKNQPVVVINTHYANAVPFGTSHWSQLQGWSRPATKRYAFASKNGFGSEVVKVIYQVHYTHSGNYQGKGKFLTGVTIEPISVTTAWGYKVTLVSEVPDSTVANVGTHEDPVASMQVQLKWVIHTAVKDISSKAIYYVQGDGALEEIGTPFKNARDLKNKARLETATARLSDVKFD
ncbi:MAG TPA: hypothetical protein DEQ38_03545 [Elusimicrobia bacterium]|nr:MAG: hypothetical protein A2089_04640 [Elusimicrobia bacterium GWD2_63_28]HCC47178.1 hypothetical protein [Elusimicrobiota bacterium]